jgi:DNA-binding response OmpR family regulator
MINILVVEDDANLNKLYCAMLQRNGYRTISAMDGQEALDAIDREVVDLIISDIMMPNMNGYELIESLREANYNMPVLMITAKHSFEDKEKGFNSGTDDYMVKPIDMDEMILRVGALLRRAKIATERKIVFGDTILDHDAFTIIFNGCEVLLPQKEFNLLYKLVAYPNKIFTRQQLMDDIWGVETETDERTVDVHINRLRDKIKNCNDIQIVTIRGLGYKAVKA